MPTRVIRQFLQFETSGGVLLFIGALLALVVSNSPLHFYYTNFFNTPLSVHIGQIGLNKPLVSWINEGLMTIFFLLIGLEIKREMIEGELNTFSKVTLPAIAAVGGMLVPACFYLWLNWGDRTTFVGWAIPTATDIAFSLGLLALLGSRVPLSLKLFLTALAIFDDIGAVVIIAIFYTATISLISLLLASLCLCALFLLNQQGVTRMSPYILLGILLWLCFLESGIQAALAGIALAFVIPLHDKRDPHHSPLRRLERNLHPWVAFVVLPLFAFANTGVSFSGLTTTSFGSIALGIAIGLFVGKQLGVFGATWLTIKLGFASLPRQATWIQVYGIALICGVGFTMSLFIGMLAFNEGGTAYVNMVRVGVLSGSLLSGLLGYLLLRFTVACSS